MSGPGVKPVPIFFLPGNSKEKFGKETPLDALIVDNLETLLVTTADKTHGNASGSIVYMLIKSRASKNLVAQNIL